jgi:hypothetical protein
LYLFFLAESDKPESTEELDLLLDQQEALHRASVPLNIDCDFALNVCKHFGRKKAQARVYAMLDFYEDAVKLALKTQQEDLARRYASVPSDEKVKKRLWLKVASWVLQKSDTDLRHALNVISDSHCLSLGDVLPYLAPKAKLATFKDILLASLQSYSTRIDEQLRQMAEYNRSVTTIDEHARRLRDACLPLPADQPCETCQQPLLGELFYVFPCRHALHQV